jgi:hypothetical protein
MILRAASSLINVALTLGVMAALLVAVERNLWAA